MISDTLLLLLRASLSASVSDREAFINRLAEIIENRTGKNAETARELSDHIAGAIEGLNGGILLQQLLRPARDKKLNRSIDNLTESIEKLRALLEQNSSPVPPDNEEEQ